MAAKADKQSHPTPSGEEVLVSFSMLLYEIQMALHILIWLFAILVSLYSSSHVPELA